MPKSNYKIGDYKVSDIYQGGYSTLAPSQNIYTTSGNLGLTTDPRTANILQDVSAKLSTGARHIEVEGVSPEIFDSIPKQQLKEVYRLSKLTGIDVSLHAPIVEPSGLTQQGYSEAERESAERRIIDSLLRAKDLNPDGNIPVNFHSAAGIPGSQFLPYSKRKEDEEYKKLIIVNRESGKMVPLEPRIQYALGERNLKPETITPEQELDMINKTEWNNSTSQLLFQKERADEILEKQRPFIEHLIEDLNSGKFKESDIPSPEQQVALRHFRNAEAYLQDLHKQTNTLFSKAAEFADGHQINELRRISENFREKTEKSKNPFTHSQAMNEVIHELREKITPKMYVPIEEFAVEKASQTFGNAAYKTYKEFKGKNVPLLVIENPPAEVALSTGEGIRDVVKKSREIFVENAKKEGMSESQARKEAEKLIGATWDVGHINMLRKYGYSEEDIVKETEKIAPYLKHIHLSDNFGFEHTELPMGMGNVPLKEMMNKLGEKGFEAKKIIEASAWWQHFKTSPFQESLEALGSPVYGLKMAPYWSQAPGLYQGYFAGMEGPWLPQINYETFGAGFSRLPSELGGSMPGAQGSRMSGRQME